ncbi:diguanylate cyclase [Tateyamaria omphalii]|uniref:diguanylate cyclase n=1 Tax=Tateyamaria omphalii TaxID=299262 RepID=UPI001C99E1B5|nr:diguanylate cyclase [Tateyamaria omphalii]MBY5932030.1 diguanylate cyclase [Tateyamaria omphalii]
MHGKVLLIDPIATNRIVLRVKLAASHYQMTQAASIAEAMQAMAQNVPDLILCATDLPDGDPVRLLRRMRKAGLAGKVPIIALSGCDDDTDRLRLLAGGVDDVMQKPINDALLLARTRSIIRAYATASEWTLREGTSRALGFAEAATAFAPDQAVRIIARDMERAEPWATALRNRLSAKITFARPATAVADLEPGRAPDALLLLVEPHEGPQMLQLLATVRSQASTRHCAILAVLGSDNMTLGAQMLDMGANDMMRNTRSADEMALRLQALLNRKRVTDALRDTVKSGIEAAVIDPLTGLHNRRYAMPHLARIAERAARTGKPYAVMVADMDHFKRINDTMGHAAGDAVLVETARRLRENLRAVDLVARIGGEEFLIVLPGAGLSNARKAAKRLCSIIEATPFDVPEHTTQVNATMSIGMTVVDPVRGTKTAEPHTPEALLDRADKALYGAKSEGRNRVTLGRPAA